MKPYKFNNEFLEPLLSKIKAEGKDTFLARDFNFNLIKYNQNKGIAEFLEHLFSKNFTPHITLPTRSTLTSQTLINNIFLNSQSHRSVSGNLTTSISDHQPQFIILENFKKLSDITSKIKFTYRHFKGFDEKCFNEELKSIDWSLATENNDLNLGFRTFFHLSNKTLDKHAPLKQGTREDKKIEQKPWVTKRIQTSMKRRDKLYKEAIKEKKSRKKIQKRETYRKYRNKIVDLLKVSKQTHYQKYFEDNKKSCKALWDGIHQIIYSKKKKDNISPSSLLVNGHTVTDNST